MKAKRALQTFIGGALLWGLMTPAAYAVEDYREITLTDGRVFVGEVTATEAGGLRTKLPQGSLLVSYHELQDMVPADAVAFERQQKWLVYVVGDNYTKAVARKALAHLPNVQMYGDTGTEGAFNSIHLGAARQCKGDVNCVSKALDPGYWLWVVSIERTESGAKVKGSLNTHDEIQEIELDSLQADALVPAFHEIFGLDFDPTTFTPKDEPVAKTRKPRKPGKKKGEFSDAKVFGMSFVPLPGYPSLAQGDAGGFALSMAVVLPATAGWIGATGKNAQSTPEHAAMSLAGFYVATVAVNQLFGMRSKRRSAKMAFGVQPATKTGEGAMVQMAIPLK